MNISFLKALFSHSVILFHYDSISSFISTHYKNSSVIPFRFISFLFFLKFGLVLHLLTSMKFMLLLLWAHFTEGPLFSLQWDSQKSYLGSAWSAIFVWLPFGPGVLMVWTLDFPILPSHKSSTSKWGIMREAQVWLPEPRNTIFTLCGH